MSYRPSFGTLEIDLTGGRAQPERVVYQRVVEAPASPLERWAAFGLTAALIAVIGYAVYKSPRTRWRRPRRAHDRRPDIRVRLNKRRSR